MRLFPFVRCGAAWALVWGWAGWGPGSVTAQPLADPGFESLAGKTASRRGAPGAWRIPTGRAHVDGIEVTGHKRFARSGQAGLRLRMASWGRLAAVQQTLAALPKGLYELRVWAKGKGFIMLAADRTRRRGALTDRWAAYSLAFEQAQPGSKSLTILADKDAQVDDASLTPLPAPRVAAWRKQEQARARYGFVPDGLSAQSPQPGVTPLRGAFVDGPVTWRDKVVFYDDRYDAAWSFNPDILADYLASNGFRRLGAVGLGEWMKQATRDGAYGTVCVMTHGVCPASVFDDKPAKSPIGQYLEAGGRVVWLGDVPLMYIQDEVHPQMFTKAAWTAQLGVRGGWAVGCWSNKGQVRITPIGKAWGLGSAGGAVIATYAEDVTAVLSGFYGDYAGANLAVAWLKTYNPRYPWSGFLYALRAHRMDNPRLQESVYRLALYTGQPVTAPPGIPKQRADEAPLRVVLDAPRDRRCYYRGETIPVRLEAAKQSPKGQPRLSVVIVRDGRTFARGDVASPVPKGPTQTTVRTADLACGGYHLRVLASGKALWETPVTLCPRRADPTFFYAVSGGASKNPYRQELILKDLAGNAMHIGSATTHMPSTMLDAALKHGLRFAMRAHGADKLTDKEREAALRRGPNGEKIAGAWEGGRPVLGLAHPTLRQRRAQDMAKQVKELSAWPGAWPRCHTNDDFSMYYGFDFSDEVKRQFKQKTGLDVPVPPELAKLGKKFRNWRTIDRPKGVVPDDDPWLQYSIFCTRDIGGGYNKALTEACTKSVPEMKVGPVPGSMQLPLWCQGQYPPHQFGPGGFNLGYYYYYLCYWQPLMGNMYWDEVARLSNRDLEVWVMPDCQTYKEPSYVRNTFFLHLAGGCQGLNYYAYTEATPVSWKELGRLGNTIVKPLYPFLGKLRPARARAGWLLPYTHWAHMWLYATSAVYPYANLKGAHLDVEPTCEEEAISGDIKRYKAILLWHVEWMRASAVKALEQYIARGGVVLADATTTVPIKGAVRLPVDLAMGTGKTKPHEDPRFGHPGILDYLHPSRVGAIRKAVEPYVTPWADCDDPALVTRRHEYRGVTYLWLVNIHTREEYEHVRPRIAAGARPKDAERARKEAYDYLLRRTQGKRFTRQVTIPPGPRAAYDVIRGKRVPLRQVGVRLGFTADMERLGGMLVALYPEPIARVVVTAPPTVRRGGQCHLTVTVVGASGKPIAGTQPLRVEVRTPTGVWPEVTGAHATDDGAWRAVLNPARNDPSGCWQVRVTEWCSGVTGETSVTVE